MNDCAYLKFETINNRSVVLHFFHSDASAVLSCKGFFIRRKYSKILQLCYVQLKTNHSSYTSAIQKIQRVDKIRKDSRATSRKLLKARTAFSRIPKTTAT